MFMWLSIFLFVFQAKHGLSEFELEDILSCDDDVLNDVYQFWTPPIRRLPPLLIVRLRHDLNRYLGTSLLTFLSFFNTDRGCVKCMCFCGRPFALKNWIYLLAIIHLSLWTVLVNRGDSGVQIMGWYHRQFWEAAEDRYTKDKDTCQRLHVGIADYFAGRWSGGKKNNCIIILRLHINK